MAIPHTLPGQVVDLAPRGQGPVNAVSAALFKSQDLEVIRLVLHAGKSLPPHKVAGEITIQCLEGSLSITADHVEHTLHGGQLLYLRRNVLHDVVALEDTSALVTIALVK